MATLDFWFEFASTYSYLAAARVGRCCKAAGVEIVYRPFLLGPIFAKAGWSDSPFNLYPAKGRYMWRDVEREAAALDLEFRRPRVFPKNGVLAARVALVAAREGFAGELVPAIFAASFARDEDISDPDVLARVAASVGREPAPMLSAAVADDNKLALRRQTEHAERLGIFGAPTFVVDDEIFWGNDRLETALRWASRGDQGRRGGACGFPNEF